MTKNELIEWILDFDGVVWRFANGYAAKLELKRSPLGCTPAQPEGIDYKFTFHKPGIGGNLGQRIYGIDNAHAIGGVLPNDHEHPERWLENLDHVLDSPYPARPIKEPSVAKSFEMFPIAINRILEKLGLPIEIEKQESLDEINPHNVVETEKDD